MSSRSFRLETRSRARDEIKKITLTVDKVRNWEKKWVDLGLSNSIKVYKWVPVREDTKEEDAKSTEISTDDTSTHEAADPLLTIPAAPAPLVHELGGPSTTLPANIFANDQETSLMQTSSSSAQATPTVTSTDSVPVTVPVSIMQQSSVTSTQSMQSSQETIQPSNKETERS